MQEVIFGAFYLEENVLTDIHKKGAGTGGWHV
jgi:hypothetical protein